MTSSLDGVIRAGRHHMQIRVYYEDTDFSGIVYHANYLRFMERGRTNHLRLMGAEQHTLFAEVELETPGFAFVVRSMQIDFLKPARMDDVLDVVTWPVAVKGASITLAQEVRRGEVVLVTAQVSVAFLSEGRAKIVALLTRKWKKEHEYRLIKDLWAFHENHIAVRFQYEWHDDAGQWHRSYGNEQWEFDQHGLMRRREASINDIAIAEKDRRFHWPAPGPRPADVPWLGESPS